MKCKDSATVWWVLVSYAGGYYLWNHRPNQASNCFFVEHLQFPQKVVCGARFWFLSPWASLAKPRTHLNGMHSFVSGLLLPDVLEIHPYCSTCVNSSLLLFRSSGLSYGRIGVFINPPVHGCSGRFQFGAIWNKASMSVAIQASLWVCIHFYRSGKVSKRSFLITKNNTPQAVQNCIS